MEFSSYSKDDVIFLLKDISNCIIEQSNLEREKAIQSGKHYSEMLPIEYQVSDVYLNLYKSQLKELKEKCSNVRVVGSFEKEIVLKGDDE